MLSLCFHTDRSVYCISQTDEGFITCNERQQMEGITYLEERLKQLNLNFKRPKIQPPNSDTSGEDTLVLFNCTQHSRCGCC